MTHSSIDADGPRSLSELQSLSHAEAVQEIQELEEKLADTSRDSGLNSLLGDVSHELRTPLTGIVMMAQTLSNRVAGGREEELATLIEKNGKQLQEILDAVLTLSKLESCQASLDTQPLRVADEVESTFRTFESRAEAKDLDYTLTVDDSEGPLYASLDSGALSSIVQNLLANAVKYTETGSVQVTVRPVSPSGSSMVEIEVADTGVGISDTFVSDLFDRFEQESPESDEDTQGVGLGLTLVKRFTERMGGQIDVESEKGRGSQFRVRFPRVPAQEVEDSFSSTSRRTPRTEKKVLFIEGNANTRRAICVLIEDRWGITPVPSSEEGLELVSKRKQARNTESPAGPPFDLVLLGVDRGEPSRDEEFLQELEERTNDHEIPVVALTPGNQRESAELEIDGTISEPFTSSRLVVEVARHLEE